MSLEVYGESLSSRMFLGTAQYPSPSILADAVRASGAEVVTVSLRREQAQGQAGQVVVGGQNAVDEFGVHGGGPLQVRDCETLRSS